MNTDFGIDLFFFSKTGGNYWELVVDFAGKQTPCKGVTTVLNNHRNWNVAATV